MFYVAQREKAVIRLYLVYTYFVSIVIQCAIDYIYT